MSVALFVIPDALVEISFFTFVKSVVAELIALALAAISVLFVAMSAGGQPALTLQRLSNPVPISGVVPPTCDLPAYTPLF